MGITVDKLLGKPLLHDHDGDYLKLDASNDPLTGDLTSSGNIILTNNDQYIQFGSQSHQIMQSGDHGSGFFFTRGGTNNVDFYFPGPFSFYANTGADGGGNWDAGLEFTGDPAIKSFSDFWPYSDSAYEMGSTDRRWLKTWTDAMETGLVNFVEQKIVPSAGDLWFNGGTLQFKPASDIRSVNLANGVIVEDVVVANTTTETTIFTETVSANELYKGSKWHTRVSGHYSTANASDTFTMKMKVGGSTIHTFTSTAENVTNGFFRIEWFFTVRETGASGSIVSSVDGVFNTTSENEANTSTTTIDTTIGENLTITVQWDSANVNNTLTITQGHTNIFGVEKGLPLQGNPIGLLLALTYASDQ